MCNEIYELQILCYINTLKIGGRAPLVPKYQIQATVSLRKELLLVPFNRRLCVSERLSGPFGDDKKKEKVSALR
jgi:hypothetical protein